ncbi:MAG TPA: SagB/ThcOx family dehydrogenase [Candidatus Methanofastidiosa archaeon]|nr:SagB/ThcOx family dehydrogenase [Candidatus Methanofastidiosa archaeon]
MPTKVGDRFQSGTKYIRDEMASEPLDYAHKPDIYKIYDKTDKIELPKNFKMSSESVLDSISNRCSVRRYSEDPLRADELSTLLWASAGIRRIEHGYAFRNAPSAGALYPIETYVAANRVENMAAGLYHYSVMDHTLELVREGNVGKKLARAFLDQSMCEKAQAIFVWSAIFERSKWKYKQRAYRYIYLDAGHMAGNLCLAASGMGLGTCQIGAFYDDEVNDILGVDGVKEGVVYASSVGYSV